MSVTSALTEQVSSLRLPEASICQHQQEIHHGVLASSRHITEPDFKAIGTRDLEFLFDAYDRRFFDGLCRPTLAGRPLRFALSDRLTVSGGVTKRFRSRSGDVRFEIAIASGMLFDSFRDDQHRVTVCGLECANRLDALQRIFEHELIHLIEHLCWENSNCARRRFQEIAARLFLHRKHTHTLLTRREMAAKSGIVRGSQVSFEFEGRRLSGRVARITKRATVLVPDPSGPRYTDGKNYRSYYVPLNSLK
jgi:hypothetical protein